MESLAFTHGGVNVRYLLSYFPVSVVDLSGDDSGSENDDDDDEEAGGDIVVEDDSDEDSGKERGLVQS